MKKVLMILTVVAVGFTSCKKEETTGGTKSTAEMIAAQWTGDEIEVNIVAPPPIGTQTTKEPLGYLKVNFKSDGTYSADSLGLNPEVGKWSAPNSSTFIMDDTNKFDIIVLTDSQFHFGIDSIIDLGGGVTASFDQTIKLKK